MKYFCMLSSVSQIGEGGADCTLSSVKCWVSVCEKMPRTKFAEKIQDTIMNERTEMHQELNTIRGVVLTKYPFTASEIHKIDKFVR